MPALDFELLFAALPAPLAALAPDGTLLALNAAMEALLPAATAAALVGQPLAALQTALAGRQALALAPAWAAGLQAVQATGSAPQVLAPAWPNAAAPTAPPLPLKHWETTLQPVRATTGAAAGALRYILVRLLEVGEPLRMQRILDQLPLTVTTMEGPEHTFTFLSAKARTALGPRVAVGQTVAASLPEVAAQGYLDLLTEVRDSGQPRFGHEERTQLLDPATGELRERYNNFGYLPLPGPKGPGVLAYSLDVTEQVQARQRNEALQAEARAADQRLRHLTESLPSITFISDQEGQVLYLSPQWYAYTGTRPAPDLSAEWLTHVHPDDLARTQQVYAAALAAGTPWRYEVRLRRHDGAYRWFVSQGVPEPLADATAAGRSRQWFGSDLDIHELHVARQHLEAKDQQLSQILSQTPALITTVEGPDHRFAFTNAGYDVMTSHRARLGRPVAECFPEVVEQGLTALLDYVYRTGQTFRGQETFLTLHNPETGEPLESYLDFTYQPLRNGQGQVTGVLGFAVDVTKQVLARREADALQAEVQAADQRLRRQAEVLPIITFTTDAEGRTTYISPQWYAFTGQAPAGPWPEVDAMWTACMHPDDRAAAQQEIQGSIDQARLGRVELRLRGADGRYRWFLTEAVPELDAAGRLVRRYGFMLDVHELRDTQRHLEAKDHQLSQILSQAPAAIATLAGPEHRYTFINPLYDALVGHRACLGMRVVDCVPEAVEQGFAGLLDQVYLTGEPFVGQAVPISLRHTATGLPQEYYIDFTYQALRDEQGQPTGVLAFIVDVTAQVLARREADVLATTVNSRDEQIRAITASVPVFIFNFDPTGAITYANPYFYEYTGMALDRALDEAWEALPPADRTATAAVAQAAMARGAAWQATFRVRRLDGELRWFQAKAQPYADAGGQLAGFSVATIEIHDLHERTDELARSRADFAALADNMAQLAWMADPNGHIFWYNQQWYDYTGTDLATMQSGSWHIVHEPSGLDDLNQRYLACIRQGEPWEDTFPLRRHDGVFRWFLSRARPIRDAATGEVLRWFGTNTDVTELRALQEQLAQGEEELRIQAESIPQQVWTARPDGTVDFYNHRTAAYLGEAMEKNGAAHGLRFVHPDDRAGMQARWDTAIASQRYYEAEFRLRRYDGQYRWFLGQAQARRAPGGQVLKWYGTNTDVHQQRLLQEQVLASQARFQQLLETLPQMTWTARADGNATYFSQRWYDYTGASFENLRDWAWEQLVHPDDLASTTRRWRHSLATGIPFEHETRWLDRHGAYRWFLVRAEAIRDAAGAVALWVGAHTDVQEFKQVQQQLEAQNARLRRTNEDLDSFVYTASHDLKQPINNMAGIFEELTRTAYFRDPEAVRLIDYFERALAQIFRTIDDLGAIVQVQRQQQQLPPETVELAPLVAEIIGSLQDQVAKSGAQFELDFATCPVISFVRPNLQSVLFNLISNSLKYAAPGRPPRIRIGSAPDAVSGRPILTVQDNGLGIDLERFGPQMFQLFRRFHAHADGTGVGLFLVNRIVQNHGGRLEVRSTVDEGTTFRIFL